MRYTIHPIHKLIVLMLLFTMPVNIVCASVKLPALISNGMVLQRDIKIPVWGWAFPGEKIKVTFNNKIYVTKTNAKGKWLVSLLPLQAGGPYVMKIAGKNEITLKNIMIGEVWICAGQSNMQLPMSFVREKYEKEITTSSNPNIRMFFVGRNASFSPVDTLSPAAWESASPQTILRYTAAGYFFAREFYKKHHIPIGLIQACWGGTPVQAWISKSGLKMFPDYLSQINTFNDPDKEKSIQQTTLTVKNNWINSIRQHDNKAAPRHFTYATINHTPDDWKTTGIPALFTSSDSNNYAGITWLRKEINIPDTLAGKPATLFLGNIINEDSTYVNGRFVGYTGDRYKLRQYHIIPSLLKPGKNLIAIRIVSIGESPAGGLVPGKAYKLVVGTKVFNLDTAWRYRQTALSKPMPVLTYKQSQPTVLFNGMIAPLIPYAMRGVLWYQGESNTNKPNEYRALFRSLINDWRSRWKQGNFPFLYVQLANFGLVDSQPAESKWAELREAQAKALSLPNTGMAVAQDLGLWNDIHPLNKQDVGKRLELAAERIAYQNHKIVYSGPVYRTKKIIGNKIILTFLNVGNGLVAKGTDTLRHFAIAGADGKFVWAIATIVDKDKVKVYSADVRSPVAVRYAWADNPGGANLYNSAGLPAAPFRTKF